MSFPSLIPKDRILHRLQFENPWWISGKVDAIYQEMSKRLYFDVFFPHVIETDVRRAVVLMGSRRVGKTVMMFHAIQGLLSTKINPEDICFVAIDNPIYINLGLEDILNIYKEAVKRQSIDGAFIFFDEIQYLEDWQNHLKVLVDTYPNTKFVVSGSATAALARGSKESGAGRFTDFMLPPLTFQEFIHLKGLDHLVYQDTISYLGRELSFFLPKDIAAFNNEFIDYINYGGYPEVVLSSKVQGNLGRFVKSDIIDKVLLRDLPSIYGIRDGQELNRFFAYLAYNTGNQFSYSKMGKESGMNTNTIKSYLNYLEAAFLIRVLNKVDENSKYLKRVTNFKVYLTNSSLRSALFSPIQEVSEEVGNLVETAIFSQWMHHENLNLAYANWKKGNFEGEVDLVLLSDSGFKPDWAVEIKWSNRFFEKPKDLKSLLQFCGQNRLDTALVTTISKMGNKEIEGKKLTFIPASVYAYNVGERTLQMKTAGI